MMQLRRSVDFEQHASTDEKARQRSNYRVGESLFGHVEEQIRELFKLGYDLISAKCKHDDLGRHVYKPQPMEDSASKSMGC